MKENLPYMDAMGGRKDAITNVLQLGFMRLIHLNLTIDPTHWPIKKIQQIPMVISCIQ